MLRFAVRIDKIINTKFLSWLDFLEEHAFKKRK